MDLMNEIFEDTFREYIQMCMDPFTDLEKILRTLFVNRFLDIETIDLYNEALNIQLSYDLLLIPLDLTTDFTSCIRIYHTVLFEVCLGLQLYEVCENIKKADQIYEMIS